MSATRFSMVALLVLESTFLSVHTESILVVVAKAC